MRRLWAPWRLAYVQEADQAPGCIFCAAAESQEDEASLVVHRAPNAIVLLNKYPYASGHLMVAPLRHTGDLGELEDADAIRVHRLVSTAVGVLADTMHPQGYNLGWNLGRVAGAGVVDHVHQHVVPRWNGDTNFMPVLADVRVMPQHLDAAWEAVRAAWQASS